MDLVRKLEEIVSVLDDGQVCLDACEVPVVQPCIPWRKQFKFQEHQRHLTVYVYKPTKCTKFLCLDFIFH